MLSQGLSNRTESEVGMIYNHEKNLKATEERIRNSSICEANKQHIFEFESFCFSDGIRIARVLKHLTELKVLAEMAGQDFKSMHKQDMMMLVGRIERMDREETTKQDYKSLIRKFFRWLGREGIVDWIKIQVRKDARKLPEDMLSEEEIEKMINSCEHPRDKAM